MYKIIMTALITLLFFKNQNIAFSQNALDEIEEEERVETNKNEAPELFTEKIQIIAPSKKIFIITNENQSFSKGDFISLLLNEKLVCRSLVAKTNDEKKAGIKIIKIYNLELWKELAINKEVKILKGDDSYYSKKENNSNEDSTKKDSKIQSDEDLYNSTSLNDDDNELSFDENSKRIIKPDNLISINVGLIEGQDVDRASKKFTQLTASWAYQLSDNVWAEGLIGTNTVRDYPTTSLDTRLINLTIRAKYIFNAPMYTYIMPYVGYQTILADSPSAGKDPNDGTSKAELQNEVDLVDEMKKSSVIFGGTILKRIVPGWFINFSLGSDLVAGGLTLEF